MLPGGSEQQSSQAVQENSSTSITYFEGFGYNTFPNVLVHKNPSSKFAKGEKSLITQRRDRRCTTTKHH